MNKMDIKSKVLQSLIDAMDEKDSETLKGKSPKFMKVETNDPEMAKSVVENALEDKLEDPSKELSSSDLKEDKSEGEPNEEDDMARMMEMMHKKFKG